MVRRCLVLMFTLVAISVSDARSQAASPTAPQFDATLSLVPPENTADVPPMFTPEPRAPQPGSISGISRPHNESASTPAASSASPTAPKFSWEQIANTAEFKALPADKQLTVLKNYAAELGAYLKSVPGSRSDAVDGQINDFVQKETKRIVKAEIDRLLPTPTPAISVIRRHIAEYFAFYLSLLGLLITLTMLYVIGWRRTWGAVVNSPMLVIIFFVCLVLITPWREPAGRSYRASGYSLLFIAPTIRSEIDVTRYAVQVFAGTGVFAAIYFTLRLRRR
jgi:hypothetical protein